MGSKDPGFCFKKICEALNMVRRFECQVITKPYCFHTVHVDVVCFNFINFIFKLINIFIFDVKPWGNRCKSP